MARELHVASARIIFQLLLQTWIKPKVKSHWSLSSVEIISTFFTFEVVFKFADLAACLSWLKQFVFSGEKVDNIEAIHHDMFFFCQDSPFRVYKYIRYANEF